MLVIWILAWLKSFLLIYCLEICKDKVAYCPQLKQAIKRNCYYGHVTQWNSKQIPWTYLRNKRRYSHIGQPEVITFVKSKCTSNPFGYTASRMFAGILLLPCVEVSVQLAPAYKFLLRVLLMAFPVNTQLRVRERDFSDVAV